MVSYKRNIIIAGILFSVIFSIAYFHTEHIWKKGQAEYEFFRKSHIQGQIHCEIRSNSGGVHFCVSGIQYSFFPKSSNGTSFSRIAEKKDLVFKPSESDTLLLVKNSNGDSLFFTFSKIVQ